METRKMLKKRARKVLKKHYLIFMVVCLVAAFIGTEFISSLAVTKIKSFPSSALMIKEEDINEAIEEALAGKEREGKQITGELRQEIIKESQKNKNEVLGRSRGVFATIVNSFSSGSIYVTFIAGMNSIIGSPNVTTIILVISSLLLSFITWFFLGNMYQVISRRMFLEGRVYEKVPMQRFLFLLRVKKWSKTSWTMFVTSVFRSLWYFTIIGGLIKKYSYFLVPYIVAENPDIAPLEAINLSRRMMNGHKWECFLLEMSYIGWFILGIFTFGLTEIFYSNMYKVAAQVEFYVALRKIAKEQQLPGVEYLNDEYLYKKADKEVLDKEYSDVIAVIQNSREKVKKPKGIKRLLANIFGISLNEFKEEEKIELEERKEIKIKILKDALHGREYPSRLFTIPERLTRPKMETINYMRRYSICSLIMMFFIFAFIGWLWEVCLHIIADGEIVKRGVLHGPWLPIYGFGSILILTVLNKFREKPIIQFITIIVLCGVIEYFTAYYLEIVHNGQKWWDYSGYFLNLHGRICAEGLLVFGVGGIAIVYVVAPLLDNIIKKINHQTLMIICCILLAIFLVDEIYSSDHPNTGKGITTSYSSAYVEKIKYKLRIS